MPLPSIFPCRNPAEVSLKDKRATLEYGIREGLSPAGLSKITGIDDRTLGVWREEVATAIRLD
ncbi:hypothetical protein FHS00_001337 [Limimaricola variabilis]|uniref:Transposase n=1 Tax=Limimaricola variabilis TaxID=1492771 RepID=A0ABR6HMH5_9RHOB|nr:hypothetical protein [Limimaricola variabilis]MBB3711766.1 hypothetical protein [Limimaricola variabilis]